MAARRSGAGYRLGQTISFNAPAASDRHLPYGWSIAEPWGRWTSHPQAQVILRIEDRLVGPLDLVARVRAFIPPMVGRQEVTWSANGQELGHWTFTTYTETMSERRLQIPRSAVHEDGTLRLDLRLSAAVSPEELGLTSDPRRLGLGIGELTLTASDVTRRSSQ